MTLAEKLHPKLNSWKTKDRATWTESFANEGWTVHLTADHNDAIATLAWELTVSRMNDAPEKVTVRSWAERIAARSSGLLEKLKLLESDAARNEAFLRSDSPSAKGDLVAYYEVHLLGTNSATVRRYQANKKLGTPREQVAFAVTHEALAKLVGDIAK